MFRVLSSPLLLLALLALIFVLHVTAIYLNWYWDFDGVDNVYHFIGGAWVALLFFYIFFTRGELFPIRGNFLPALIFSIGFVLLISVGWEFFEFIFDQFFGGSGTVRQAQLGVADTMGDLFSDIVGGMTASLLFIFSSKK
ncbi:MAG: hypothetical protein COU07_01990 [Candidatus Harrisonbacteria bacterium CG10_big_fil_rev_8_21_14_0_10_40_38]|uniref:VanZ-like domain-containing protein n=1 Tax=Candidatus Harrisonbacteria bacterium CG10_big_fil_rev_8_21_14_0_10_40_38 TaxID=1974583 RepID=A0A2H0US12_9BACT|nr:MAG: hypothetical protein COU07_01990 [Candidatus Harrisonbacteria bacterium CG10_big_fil_rev_8_21_14_0_10_40_38]